MAKAISHIEIKSKSKDEEQAESLTELLSFIADNKESITTTLEIIKELHSAGLLDIIKGFLKTRDKIGVIAMDQINQPSMHRTIKNGIQAVQLLGELDPDNLSMLLNAANSGLENTTESNEKLSKWGMLKSINDPNVSSSFSMMIKFLKGMGKELNKHKTTH
jgi:uncharacterized protein YjgD (DUF1641 family)